MKTKYLLFAPAMAVLSLVSCQEDNSFTPDYTLTIGTDTVVNVTIDASTTYQTIQGFASSDAWNMDYVGKYWSNEAKEGIAKLLFSQNINSGQPDGIGLSMWRVNLGGGTAEQGNDSGINDKPERRAECFLSENGSYNWSKASGQQYFMGKAKEYGVQDFVLFSNTPPVYYTKNGKGFSNSGAYANLKSDCYDDFADFLASCAQHFNALGYNISYISPVNEPQYNWNGGQEGSGWQNSEVAKLTKELDAKLTSKSLPNTKILLGEAGDWSYLYDTSNSAGAGRSNVIKSLFDSSSENYVGNLSHVPALVCAHSYWLDTSMQQMQTTRRKAAEAAAAQGLSLWQTEWSMMSEQYEGINYSSANYIDLALTMSTVMHNDLTEANVTSWSYWTTCERERWDQKSRFYLIRLVPTGGDYGDLDAGGTYQASKNLWVLGNYSLFVRPGYKRIAVNVSQTGNQLLASAYLSPQSDKLVVVYTNLSKKTIKIEPTINVSGRKVVNVHEYVTSSARDLKLVGSEETSVLRPRSVSTLIYDLE